MKPLAPAPRSPLQPMLGPDSPGGDGANSRFSRLPLLLIVMLFACLLLPRVQQDWHLVWAFAGTGSTLLVWHAVLGWRAARQGRQLLVESVPPVRQHYIQACVQLCLYAYWGWYWRPIYEQAPLILAQFFFLFAFDALFAWSRGRSWRLTSGPVPIVLSTNLFIWFIDSWFVLQFVMLIIGLLGKEFLKWQKEGRRTHIFNPSGFGLLVTAAFLIATGTTDALTHARPLATTIDAPPHIFLFLFCLGLVVQNFFAVTLMTFAAAVTVVAINLGYTWATDVYVFATTNLPAAGWLGLHLLMTDPSTSPRSNLGRLLFGTGYGIGYVVLYDLLGRAGNLEIYAKLFPVPILNLTVRWLDHVARSGWTGRLNRGWETAQAPRRMNLLHMAAWSAIFFTLLGTGYFATPHPGSSVLFWKEALAADKPRAAHKIMLAIAGIAKETPGDAYNEIGILRMDERCVRANPTHENFSVGHWFRIASTYANPHACRNLLVQYLFGIESHPDRDVQDAIRCLQQELNGPHAAANSFLLGLAHETGRGLPPDTSRALLLYRQCGPDHVLAGKGIARLALRPSGLSIGVDGLAATLARAAATGDAEACWYLAHMHASGRGVARDDEQAKTLLEQAAKLGLPSARAALRLPLLPPFAPLPASEMARPAWSTAFPL